MQILLLGMFLAIYLHDATTQIAHIDALGVTRWTEALPAEAWPYLSPWPVLAIVLLPKLLLAAIYGWSCRRTLKRLGKANGLRIYRRNQRLTDILPLLALLLFGADLIFGGLRTLRIPLQNTVALDEAFLVLPTFALILFGWWSYYPIDRRLRESAVMRQADEGLPIYPIWSRSEYVINQVRHQMLLLLLPLMAVLIWSESVLLLGPGQRDALTEAQVMWATPVGSMAIFLFAPLVVRYAWDTVPLPEGEVRERMLELCRREKVKVRELLLWRTGGGMVNAAVAGLIAPLRYILLSDALLDQVDRRAIEGVMAHELAHARKHHIFWMLLTLFVTLGLIELVTLAMLNRINQSISPWNDAAWAGILRDPAWQTYLIAVPAFGLTLLVFGWVSRRIERQADVFAARYLSQTAESPELDELGRPIFDAVSVGAMVRALQRVAELNHMPVTRRSWRHGTIAWRQAHLHSLVGQPLDGAEIDRVIGRVKAAALIGAVVIAAVNGWQYGVGHEGSPAAEAASAAELAEPGIILDSPLRDRLDPRPEPFYAVRQNDRHRQ